MTKAEFTKAIQDNEADYFCTFRALGDRVEIQRDDEATLLSTQTNFWLFNGVFRPSLTQDTAPALLDKWIQHFEEKSLPFGVFLYPPNKTHSVEEILKAKGFVPKDESQLVIFDTQKIKLENVPPLSWITVSLELETSSNSPRSPNVGLRSSRFRRNFGKSLYVGPSLMDLTRHYLGKISR